MWKYKSPDLEKPKQLQKKKLQKKNCKRRKLQDSYFKIYYKGMIIKTEWC